MGDGKTAFYRQFADWLELWGQTPSFGLSRQTSNALIRTLRAHASLIDELLVDDYGYVLTRRLQSDPIEKRFSQYRQMSGGRFLVSLREMLNSERILACRSLLKSNVNFWEEDLEKECNIDTEKLDDIVQNHDWEILEATLSAESEEVAYTISGYITKKLLKRSKCQLCKMKLVTSKAEISKNHYLSLLSRGGLTVPSSEIAGFVCNSFAVLDVADKFIEKTTEIKRRAAAEFILKEFSTHFDFTRPEHVEWGEKFTNKIVVNIFYNNKQKRDSDKVRKSDIVAFKKRQRKKKE